MTDEGYKRRLRIILSSDLKDYSRLMGNDEEYTIGTIRVNRAALNGFRLQAILSIPKYE
jgi:hypothetical protein